MGGAFAFSGGLFFALPNVLAMGIFFCAMLGMAWGVKKLRERVTYPRGGYVAINEAPRMRRAALGFIMFGFFIFARDVFTFPASEAVALTVICFASYMFYGISYRMPYMFWVAACSALLGVWVYLRHDSRENALAFVILWEGVVLVAAGGFRMWRFIKAHPRPAEAEV